MSAGQMRKEDLLNNNHGSWKELLSVRKFQREKIDCAAHESVMEIQAKEKWENFLVDTLRGPLVKEFAKLKTDGERFQYCKNILRNSPTAQQIIDYIQKLLNTRGHNGESAGNMQEYCCVGEEHIKRNDFKKAVICYSMAIQQAMQINPGCSSESCLQENTPYQSLSSHSTDSNISRCEGNSSLAVLYVRRAEVLFEAQEYKACLSDIQEAMSLHCSHLLTGKLASLQKSCLRKLEKTKQLHGIPPEEDVPNVVGGSHSKIANGSSLIEINCTNRQGRFLQASDDIRAGDTLISEPPFAAVLLPENIHSHCDYCFQSLVAPYPCQQNCKILYCSPSCREKAWFKYHSVECTLLPLLNVVDTLFRLSLRILLVTGTENILGFLKELSLPSTAEDDRPNKFSGCSSEGRYLGDYSSVFSLVTNTELQPVNTLMSHALNSALMSEFLESTFVKEDSSVQDIEVCENCVNNRLGQPHEMQFEKLDRTDSSLKFQSLLPGDIHASLLPELHKTKDSQTRLSSVPADVMGCLLFHHSQQMACNVHAITSITSPNDDDTNLKVAKNNVVSRQQKRIATAIYPTASLLNHACDPDVIVSFVNGHLVVRATHNISKGSEISHCYGPHASRMGREDRQKLLYKQYFFTCQCNACKSDEEMENKRLCFSAFACPKCKHAMKLTSVDQSLVGKCQNRDCSLEKGMLEEGRQAREAELLFVKGIRLLERVGVKEALDVFHECLRRRKGLLHKYHKDLAETHDAVARCYAMMGDFKKASHFCSQSSEAVEKAFGTTSVEYAHELHKLSQLLFNDRQIKKALSTIDKASSLLTRHYGRNNPDVRELGEMKRCLVAVGGHSRTSNS